jgi:hypothetical protein
MMISHLIENNSTMNGLVAWFGLGISAAFATDCQREFQTERDGSGRDNFHSPMGAEKTRFEPPVKNWPTGDVYDRAGADF